MSARVRMLPALLLLGLGACAELDTYGYEDDYGYSYGYPSYGTYGGYYGYSPPVVIDRRPRHYHYYDRDWDRDWDRDRHRGRDRDRTRYDEPRRPDPPRPDINTQLRDPLRGMGGDTGAGSTIGGQLGQVRPTPSPPSPPSVAPSPPRPSPSPSPSRTFDQSVRERQSGGMGSALQGMMGR